MRIATLQFSPKLGEMAANFSHAESLLMRAEREDELRGLDLLVLPELAFAGYNHDSFEAIAPFLEPTARGMSTRWAARTARRLQCTVAVGYAEAAQGEENQGGKGEAESGRTKGYNSLVFVDCTGEVVAHYRKSFLFYTDERWAQEGDAGFYAGVLPLGSHGDKVKMAAGICMDVNPYRFEAPWTAFEFATHAREARAKVVVVSMAWLTRLTAEDMAGPKGLQPDTDTLGYWVERFRPLTGVDGWEEEVVVVFANRAGEDGWDERIGEVRYAGSSAVMGMKKGDGKTDGPVRMWNVLGRAQQGIMVVDTEQKALYEVTRKTPQIETLAEISREMNGMGAELVALGC